MAETLILRPSSCVVYEKTGVSVTGANQYQNVDETTKNEDDYNYPRDVAANQWKKNLYGYPDHTDETGTINKVVIKSYLKRNVLGEANPERFCIRISGTDYYGSEFNGQTSTTLHTWDITSTIEAHATLDWDFIDALVAGLYGRTGGVFKNASWGNYEYQTWVEVEYEPISIPESPANVAASENNSSKVIVTWTKSEGATGYKIYRDGNLIDTVGDVATYDDTGADAPVITAGSAVASDGTSSAHVALSLSGTSIANGTTHSYTVKATNASGDSDASSADNGYRLAGSIEYQWQRSSADADADYSNIEDATTASYNDTGAPEDGSGRYYKCILSATGSSNQTTAVDRGYILVTTVDTAACSNIGSDSGTANGEILNISEYPIVERGFIYIESADAEPEIDDPGILKIYENTLDTIEGLILKQLNGVLVDSGYFTFDDVIDLGAIFTVRAMAQLTTGSANISEDLYSYADLFNVANLYGMAEGNISIRLEISKTNDDPAGEPEWSEWEHFIIGDYTGRAFRFRIYAETSSNSITPVIYAVYVEIDMVDRVYSFEETVEVGGITISFDPPFLATPHIGVSILSAQSGDYYIIDNKDETGFDIEIFNGVNSVEREISGIAKGYGTKEV